MYSTAPADWARLRVRDSWNFVLAVRDDDDDDDISTMFRLLGPSVIKLQIYFMYRVFYVLLVCLFVCGLWYINLCRLFNAKSIFIQINSSISNNTVSYKYSFFVYTQLNFKKFYSK